MPSTSSATPATQTPRQSHSQVAESHSSIRHNIAAAQRGEGTHAVVAIGNLNARSRTQAQATNFAIASTSVPAMSPAPSHIVPRSQYKYNTINVVAPANIYSSLPFPSILGEPLVNPGYQEAHEVYTRMRKYFQKQAYTTAANAELITAKFWMMVRIPNKKHPIQVSSVFEAISDIPVHIGQHDLKMVGFYALLPHFLQWSHNFPLHIDNCTLRNKDWVELLPRRPDVDVIADRFFDYRGKNKAVKVFLRNKDIELYISISNELYESIQDYIEAEEAKLIQHPTDDTSIKHNTSPVKSKKLKKRATGKKRKQYESEEEESHSIAINLRKRLTLDRGEGPSTRAPSPDASQVRQALKSQVPPRRQNIKLLFDTITISLQFFRLPKASFANLINNRDLFLDPQRFESTTINLNYNPTAKQHSGGFKVASYGYTSFPIFGEGSGNKVCFKQCYNTKPGTLIRQIYKGVRQAEDLTMELNCIGWASTLMDLVYDYMDTQEETRGQPSFNVPKMRFIQAGLAIANTEDKAVYLIEEFIDSDPQNGGWFIKYLNNRSAIPRTFADEDKVIRAEFLAFCQHFQYWKTDGLAFVSDLQGGRDLLTDPQIITAPELGNIFAEGNTNFNTFTRQHECNRFCTFYELPALQPFGDELIDDKLQDKNHYMGDPTESDRDEDTFPSRIAPIGATLSNSHS